MQKKLMNRSKIPIPLVRMAQIRAIRKIGKISKGTIKENENPKKIIFNRVYTTYNKTLYQVIGIAKALQLMGHDVKFLICGGRFKNCTTVFSIQQKEAQSICRNCALFGSEILTACGIPFDTYENILSSKSRSNNYPPELEQSVNNSIIRYFKGYDTFSKHPDFDKIKEDRSCNAVDSLSVGKIVYEKEKPDIVFSAHCTYTEWSPFTQYMRNKGVKCIVWDYTYGDDIIFDIEKVGKMFNVYKKNHPLLTKNEKTLLHEHMEGRKKGDVDTQIYEFDPKQKIRNEKKYDKTYALFPNMPWDSSLVSANKIFDSVYDWIDTTVKHFKSNQNNFLYIKIHPAEFVYKSHTTVVDYINKHHAPLTKNIRIIDDRRISSYVLCDNIDVCVVCNGTTGLEMSILGVPTIIVGHVHYEGQGFTYEPETVIQYHKLLDNPPPKLDKERIKKAECFGYYYLVRNRIPMTYVSHGKLGANFIVKNFDDILDDKNVQIALRYILNDVCIAEKKMIK